jgi:hypothetical protein
VGSGVVHVLPDATLLVVVVGVVVATQPCYGYSLGVSHDEDQEDSVLASLGAHRVLGSDSVDSGSGESAAIDG